MGTPIRMQSEETKGPVLTPMLQQYMELKKQHADSILFFRLGDFYEMFFDDAVKAAPLLEVQLTSRDKNSANPIPLCGIPYHAATGYVQKLVSRGYKVAICEQIEEPVPGKPGKTTIRREVVRVVTPSLIGDPDQVPEENKNWLLAVQEVESGFELVAFDLLGGVLRKGTVSSLAALLDAAYRVQPKELLVQSDACAFLEELKKTLPPVVVTVREYFKKGGVEAIHSYLKEKQKLDLQPFLNETEELFSKENL